MILAEKLQELISLKAPTLTRLAKENGYKGPAFSSSKFLGVTNGGQICYMAVFLVEGGTDSTKVFLSHTGGRVIADVQLTEWA
jgi:hypothetical protein